MTKLAVSYHSARACTHPNTSVTNKRLGFNLEINQRGRVFLPPTIWTGRRKLEELQRNHTETPPSRNQTQNLLAVRRRRQQAAASRPQRRDATDSQTNESKAAAPLESHADILLKDQNGS